MKKDEMDKKDKSEVEIPKDEPKSLIEVMQQTRDVSVKHNQLCKFVKAMNKVSTQNIQTLTTFENKLKDIEKNLSKDISDKSKNIDDIDQKIEEKFIQLNLKLEQIQSQISKDISVKIEQINDSSLKLENQVKEMDEKLLGLISIQFQSLIKQSKVK